MKKYSTVFTKIYVLLLTIIIGTITGVLSILKTINLVSLQFNDFTMILTSVVLLLLIPVIIVRKKVYYNENYIFNLKDRVLYLLRDFSLYLACALMFSFSSIDINLSYTILIIIVYFILIYFRLKYEFLGDSFSIENDNIYIYSDSQEYSLKEHKLVFVESDKFSSYLGFKEYKINVLDKKDIIIKIIDVRHLTYNEFNKLKNKYEINN